MEDQSKLPKTLDFDFKVDNFSHNIPVIEKILEITDKKKTDKLDVLEIDAVDGRSTVWFLDKLLLNRDSHLDVISKFLSEEKYEDLYLFNLSLTSNVDKIKSYKGETHQFLKYMFQKIMM